MAFNLHEDELGDFHGQSGKPTIVKIVATETTLTGATYNHQPLPISGTGTVTFTPVHGPALLSLVVLPAVPPQDWEVVEVDDSDSAKTNHMRTITARHHSNNLIIVGD